ncbi:serine/threonine-protein kinase [Microbacterium arborescens]|uniref:serine/threonine-protein kinase n=1 Tax=Microbacterium arborescens TaxID=33883 RepID=UPI000DF82D76|nr:serine/threonine-protein kinase [Microbacterium arborescens]
MATNEPPPTEAMLDGRYLLGECVGQGGMARVHRAEDVLLGRTVAIKLLRPELEGATTSSRARSEMTVLASLNHPALVTLYDAQLAPGRAEYLVMEFVDGPTLAARIAGGPLPAGDVAALTADLAEALHVVHDAGIVHRDIKPSNVLLSQSPMLGSRSGAKLADFGISVLVDAARLTQPGTVIGTAAYLSPEQLTGAPPAPPADIYALGLVVLEALTGQRGFPRAEGFGEALARLTIAPEIPDTLDPAWAALLRGMTAMRPEDRPSAAEVFSAANELAERPAAPAPPSVPASVAAATPVAAATGTTTRILPAAAAGTARAPVRERRRPSRARIGLIGGVAAATLAATALGGMWLAGSTGETAPSTPADTEQSAVPEPTITETTEPVTVVDEQTDESEEQPAAPVENTTEQDGPASEADRKAAEEAAKKAEREAEKAADEQKKAEERENKRDQDKPGRG